VVAEENRPERRIRKNVFKLLKAAVKATIVYVVYIILVQLLHPVSMLIPGLQQMIQTFVAVYIVLMIIGDVASGTLFQHVFNAAKALLVMVYLVFFLNTGILEYTFGSVNLIVDVRLFLIVAMLFGLLGLARSILQAINYVSEKAELVRV
jgi:hypothetical protein